MPQQLPLFPDYTRDYPSTRYQGSKAKLVDWIGEKVQPFAFDTCLDAFGGTGVVSYYFKQQQKHVTYNDYLRFNYHFGHALIANADVTLSEDDMDRVLTHIPDTNYPDFIQRTFEDTYFTDAENQWLDQTITNIWQLENPFKQSIAFFALAQAAIVKRPYNLFHRKNLYIRTADVERSFGNKASWDKPFVAWFRQFVQEANASVFDNGRDNLALNSDVLALPTNYDLVYLDPPYISSKGSAVDYRDFYHFLEGLTMYDDWSQHVDYDSKHRRLTRQPNRWADKHQIANAFADVFDHFKDSILVVSYRSDGIPTLDELTQLMKEHKKQVDLHHYGTYQYALSTNRNSQEILLIGY